MAINVQLNKLHKKFGRSPSDVKELHFLVYTEALIKTLDEALTHYPADLVIIDVLMDLYSGSINETNKVRNFMQAFQELAVKQKCLIGFVHHNGKRTQMFAPHKDNMLGSQGIESKARLVLELRNDPKVTGKKHLCILKGNYLPASLKEKSYEMSFDENHLYFETTGKRVSFEELVVIPRKRDGDDLQRQEMAFQLRNEGYTYEHIAEKMGIKSKSTIHKLLNLYGTGKIPPGTSIGEN